MTNKAQMSKKSYVVVDTALNQKRRGRECVNGHRFNTFEITEAELHRLRRLSFLGLKQEVTNV